MSDPKKGSDKGQGERKANRRGAARLAAVQALYQMDIAGAGIGDIFAEFESHWLGSEVEGDTYLPAEAAFFKDVVSGVVRDQTKIDPLIDKALESGWLKRIDAILRATLRAGLMSSNTARTFRRVLLSRNMSMSPMLSWTRTKPAW
jgi:N utilization substance protein B